VSFKNLSKTFRYVNENGSTLIFEYANGYLINKPSGIDTVQVNLSQAQGINQVGGTVESKTVQPRPVTISGIICGADQTARKTELMSVIRPDIPGKLYADDYYLNVHVTATPVVEARQKFAHFQFSITAPYPYWQKDNAVSQALSGVQRQFKFPWNISKPYRFGELMETQFMNVHNGGQLPVPFTVTFYAKNDVVNPRITHVTTGEELILNKSMVTGERVVVEITHDRTYVTSSADGNIRGALDLDSTLFRLGVGDNVLKPDAESGLKQLEVQINFATEIVGVVL
jgi:phage-related protein